MAWNMLEPAQLVRADDILSYPTTSGKGGVYYYSEQGDRLIDLASFREKLWQKFKSVHHQLSNIGSDVELNDVKETIQQLLRWGWKHNKNLEEQAAQLHMLTGSGWRGVRVRRFMSYEARRKPQSVEA
ncbi:hypothetical protein CerSpe_167750 [Prunus speciosa]